MSNCHSLYSQNTNTFPLIWGFFFAKILLFRTHRLWKSTTEINIIKKNILCGLAYPRLWERRNVSPPFYCRIFSSSSGQRREKLHDGQQSFKLKKKKITVIKPNRIIETFERKATFFSFIIIKAICLYITEVLINSFKLI